MRALATIVCLVLVMLLAAPAVAQQKPHRRQCIKLTQQIARYERDARWAHERDNELWEASSLAQMESLANRRARLCPEFRKENPFVKLAEVIGAAARLAARYFIRQGF